MAPALTRRKASGIYQSRPSRHEDAGYTGPPRYMLPSMSKHLIDLDEDALSAARAELGTLTIKDTVNQALRLATEQRRPRVTAALDTLGAADLRDRADAWR